MRKIDKSAAKILSTKYKSWLDKLDQSGADHDANYRYYYDDIAMNLYKCQAGVCAYTEMHLCKPGLYSEDSEVRWEKGKYKITDNSTLNRKDHFGEMDHFDPDEKKLKYWNWHNLFMIHSSVNSRKTNKPVIAYLKPDLPGYSPEKYFDYDETTNDYYPNTDIKDDKAIKEIQYMIDEVLCLNHSEVKYQRYNYLNLLKFHKENGEPIIVDQFFTAVKWALGE